MPAIIRPRPRLVLLALAVAVAVAGVPLFASVPTTHAQLASRTWVSGTGNDANACTRTAPCATFAGALGKTAAGGEIDALDPGEFGRVTINKAITIDGSGTFASIFASASTIGMLVSAGDTDVVV